MVLEVFGTFFDRIDPDHDQIISKLPALHFYQLALPSVRPRPSIDPVLSESDLEEGKHPRADRRSLLSPRKMGEESHALLAARL